MVDSQTFSMRHECDTSLKWNYWLYEALWNCYPTANMPLSLQGVHNSVPVQLKLLQEYPQTVLCTHYHRQWPMYNNYYIHSVNVATLTFPCDVCFSYACARRPLKREEARWEGHTMGVKSDRCGRDGNSHTHQWYKCACGQQWHAHTPFLWAGILDGWAVEATDTQTSSQHHPYYNMAFHLGWYETVDHNEVALI